MATLKTEQVVAKQNKESPVLEEHSDNIGSRQITSLQHYSGPIPPPDYLAAYEKILPGIARKFLEEPQREAEHRRGLQTKLVDAQIKLANRGQKLAFILAVLAASASISLIYFGHDIGGLGSLFLSIAAFVGIFIYGKHKSERS